MVLGLPEHIEMWGLVPTNFSSCHISENKAWKIVILFRVTILLNGTTMMDQR